MKKLPVILTIGLIVIVASVFGVVYHYQTKTKYNESYVNGNTAGNLYNAGLFCESNGTVFFANPDDKYRLYSMDLDGSNLAKLSDDTVMYINADSYYVYYVRNDEHNSTHFNFSPLTTTVCAGSGATVSSRSFSIRIHAYMLPLLAIISIISTTTRIMQQRSTKSELTVKIVRW